MAKPKGSKFKKQEGKRKKGEKRSHSRGGGFGFTKSRELKEIVGSSSPKHSSVRSTLIDHDAEEEVYVVSSGSILDEKPQFAKFKQLSTVSITSGTATPETDLEHVEEDLGFFFDSAPSINKIAPEEFILPEIPQQQQKPALTKYQQQKKKIIQDDSVHISSDDDDDDTLLNGDDDGMSISSNEDIEILQSLSHWGKNDILQFNEPTKRHKMTSDDEDYAMLEGTTLDDICDSEEEFTLDNDEEDNILLDDDMSFDSLENVPESLKNSYRGIIQQEKNRVKKQAKNRRKLNQRKKNMEKASKADTPRQSKNNMLDQVLHEFIRRDNIQTYKLSNLTYHGRNMVVPKIAKLFQLEISESESNKKNIVLTKTLKTCIPPSYKEHLKKTSNRVTKFSAVSTKSRTLNTKSRKRDIMRDFRANRDNQLHGKLVASDSVPISASNIGHRMLAAMGWKEGKAIGNNEDGIKEPVQVFMRANRRGLGA